MKTNETTIALINTKLAMAKQASNYNKERALSLVKEVKELVKELVKDKQNNDMTKTYIIAA